jgi:hypothetical protein
MDIENSKETPIIHMAPQHKPIPDKSIPQRPKVEMPAFCNMRQEDLFAAMVTSILGVPVDYYKYKTNQAYKAEIDYVFFTGIVAMCTFICREHGFPIEQYMEDNQERFRQFMIKKKLEV